MQGSMQGLGSYLGSRGSAASGDRRVRCLDLSPVPWGLPAVRCHHRASGILPDTHRDRHTAAPWGGNGSDGR